MSCTVRKKDSYCSSAIRRSSCSICARTLSRSPPGQRQRRPSSVSWRSQLVARVAFGHQFARILVLQLVEVEACSARRCAASRPAARAGRSRPAPGACAGAARRWGTGARRPRAPCSGGGCAVSVSCSTRRSRACMCTSPAATSGSPSAAPRRCSACRRRASSAPRCSSTAIHSRPGEARAQPLALFRHPALRAGSHSASVPRQAAVEVATRERGTRPCRRAGVRA